MNWLERARSEITKSAGRATAVTADGSPTAVLAVPHPGVSGSSRADTDGITDWWQERAAIMEFDGGLSRDDAERTAWVRVLARFELPAGFRLH